MTQIKNKILLVEDEVAIRKIIEAALPSDQYQLISAESAEEGVRLAAMHKPDAIILDLGLPGADGFTVIERVRQWSEIPIIILSARTLEDIKVKALDMGANDYVTKPFSVAELLARLRVVLRSTKHSDGQSTLSIQGITLDLVGHIAMKDKVELKLTPTEFKLLSLLMRNADKVLTHKYLLHEVWGAAYGTDVQYLRVFMKQLREKIEIEPARPKLIITDSGIGYRFVTH